MSMKCELFFSILDARGISYTTIVYSSKVKYNIKIILLLWLFCKGNLKATSCCFIKKI